MRPTRKRRLILFASALTVEALPCNFCRYADPEASVESLILRDKSLDLEEVAESCGELYDLSIRDELSEFECALVQSISTICGCPTRDEACSLCGVNTRLPDESLSVQVTLPTDIAAVAEATLGVDRVSCEFVQAYAESKKQKDGGRCLALQTDYAETCGCPVSNTTTINEVEQDGDESNEERTCRFCKKDAITPIPERDLSMLLQAMSVQERDTWEDHAQQNGNLTLTCGTLESYFMRLPSGHSFCGTTVEHIAQGLCQCPPHSRFCSACEDMKYPDRSIGPLLAEYWDVEVDLTCAEMQAVARQFRYDGAVCFAIETNQYYCGCGDMDREYLGASTESQKAWLVWLPRFTALVSIVGSSMIGADIARDMRKRTQVYEQIVFSMSIFDLFTSFAWIFSAAPQPTTDFGIDTAIYGAVGSSATCAAQGFFLQLGQTGMFFNLSLCIYHALVIVFRFRDSQMKRWLFHVPPIVIGLALAMAGIPYYTYLFVICHIPPPPLHEDSTLFRVFIVAPIGTVMVACFCCMSFIYYKVWRVDRAANRWRIEERISSPSSTNGSAARERQSSRPRHRLSNAVLWRATLYTLGFLLTWPIYFWGAFRIKDVFDNYTFWVLVVCLNPLQGFWNALVYFDVRITEWFKKKRLNLRLKRRGPETDISRISHLPEHTDGAAPKISLPDTVTEKPMPATRDSSQPPEEAQAPSTQSANELKSDQDETNEEA